MARSLLCVAAVVLWVRSYFHSDLVDYVRHRPVSDLTFFQDSYQFSSSNGGEGSARAPSSSRAPPRKSPRVSGSRAGTPSTGRYRLAIQRVPWRYYGGAIRAKEELRLGFAYRSFDTRATGIAKPVQAGSLVILPWPFLVLVSAILPAADATVRLRARRAARRGWLGLCVSRGYDVRATPGRCSDCGAAAVG